MFGKNLVPVLLAKMPSANQIAVFLNEQNVQNKSMKQIDFVQVDTNSKNETLIDNFLGGNGPK